MSDDLRRTLAADIATWLRVHCNSWWTAESPAVIQFSEHLMRVIERPPSKQPVSIDDTGYLPCEDPECRYTMLDKIDHGRHRHPPEHLRQASSPLPSSLPATREPRPIGRILDRPQHS